MSDYSQSRTEHYRMSYIAESQAHGTGNSKPLTQSHSLQDQAHLMALTSEWGHSVFELHGSRENIERSHGKHVSDVPYKMPIYESQNISMIHNTEEPTYVRPSYMYRQESHANNSGHSYPVQEKLKEEPEDANYVEYIPPKNDGHKSENVLEKEKQCTPELPKLKKCSPETDIIEKSPPIERVVSPKCRSSQWKGTKLSEEEIAAKRAAQAAAQREVRRRRREKMSEEEKLSELAALAASQRESRRRQREKMTEEELHLRRTLSAITQREIRRRRMSSMTEEELKAYRAREAQRQKELRHRKRMAMTEEELKIVKAKEAAASAARRARRLGKEVKSSRLKVDKPDSSPS
ncbi:golgin subfamily A member 6-like protein 26 [Palaemon carinicauda]|uniref:golgin subfamily A member 6-like protein 26 n=1 Tax=Palaemon carinicauda TaxID=392227 RepID=UPI0035B5AFA4